MGSKAGQRRPAHDQMHGKWLKGCQHLYVYVSSGLACRNFSADSFVPIINNSGLKGVSFIYLCVNFGLFYVFFVLFCVFLSCSVCCLFCVVLCIVCMHMCTVLLPLGGYPITVKCIIYHKYIYLRFCAVITICITGNRVFWNWRSVFTATFFQKMGLCSTDTGHIFPSPKKSDVSFDLSSLTFNVSVFCSLRSFHSRKKVKQGLTVKRRGKKRLKNRTSRRQTSVKIVRSRTLLRQGTISQQRFLLQWRSTRKYFLW